MKKISLKLMALVCIVAISSVVFAQAPGRGPGGGQGQGQPGGGRQGGMQRMGGGGVLGLLGRKDVVKDLALTDAQQKQIQAINQKMQEQMRAAMEEARNGGGDPQGMREAMQVMMKASEKEVMAVLTADQAKRLMEIRIQIEGNRIILDPEIQTKLNFTAAQKDAVKAAQKEQQDKMQAMREEMQNGGMDREAMQKAQQEMQKAMDAKLGAILTQAQKDQLKAMSGKPFVADANQGRPGGGPGGGGGGGL